MRVQLHEVNGLRQHTWTESDYFLDGLNGLQLTGETPVDFSQDGITIVNLADNKQPTVSG